MLKCDGGMDFGTVTLRAGHSTKGLLASVRHHRLRDGVVGLASIFEEPAQMSNDSLAGSCPPGATRAGKAWAAAISPAASIQFIAPGRDPMPL